MKYLLLIFIFISCKKEPPIIIPEAVIDITGIKQTYNHIIAIWDSTVIYYDIHNTGLSKIENYIIWFTVETEYDKIVTINTKGSNIEPKTVRTGYINIYTMQEKYEKAYVKKYILY